MNVVDEVKCILNRRDRRLSLGQGLTANDPGLCTGVRWGAQPLSPPPERPIQEFKLDPEGKRTAPEVSNCHQI